jgi:hypothetical protein
VASPYKVENASCELASKKGTGPIIAKLGCSSGANGK